MTKNKKRDRLTQGEIMHLLYSPRGALERIMACGGIDEYDFNSLHIVRRLSVIIEDCTKEPAPHNAAITRICTAIGNGDAVEQETIEEAQAWLTKYAHYLAKVPRKEVAKAAKIMEKEVRDGELK